MTNHQHLYLLRKQSHLSQEQVARRLNMTQSAYGKLERGETRLTTDRIYQLAEVFKVDPNEILHPQKEKKMNSSIFVNDKELFLLQRDILAIFKHQIEILVWSKYAGIAVNYEGVESSYEELPDFLIKMYQEDYNINSGEDYDNAELCPKPFYNTDEEEYDAFKKLMKDSDIYYLFKHGLYDFEEDVTLSRCWKKYKNEKDVAMYPADLNLSSDMIRSFLRTISTDNLYQQNKFSL